MAVGYLSARRWLPLVLAGAAVPLALILAIQISDGIGWWVLGIPAAAGFVRFRLPTGTESEIVMSMVLTGAIVTFWVTKMLVIEKRLHLKPAPTNAPLLGFVGASIISLFWGIAFRDPLVTTWGTFPFVQLASLGVMILLPAAFLLVGNTITESKQIRLMVGLILVIGVLGLAREWTGLRIGVNTLGIFPMWCSAIGYGLALFNEKMPIWQRILLVALAVGWVWYGYPTRITWLAGWVPTFAALSVLTVLRFRWALIIVLIVLLLVGYQYFQIRYEGEVAESGRTRWTAWVQNWKVTREHLLFGTGPAGYAAYYMSYFPTSAMATHSNFIDLLSQTGIVGLLFLLWFLGALLWQGYRLTHRLRGRSDFTEGLANVAFAGTVACVVAMGIGDWMIPFAYTQTITGFDYVVYNWLLIGLIPALDYLTGKDNQD
jgi:O-antigen ligase